MSNAFDNIKRDLLIGDLKEVLNNVHLEALLWENMELCVKLGNLQWSALRINIGLSQGDGVSASFSIVYLAKSLQKRRNNKVLNALEGLLAFNSTTKQKQKQ